jgi:hypothetical protein
MLLEMNLSLGTRPSAGYSAGMSCMWCTIFPSALVGSLEMVNNGVD